MSKLGLPQKKNIRDGWDAKNPELLTRLKNATGADWKFDINFEEFNANLAEEDRRNQIGDVAFWNMEALVENIERKTKDDLTKAALLDNIKNRVIKFSIGTVKGSYDDSYHDTLVSDQGISVVVKKDAVATNVSYIGGGLEKALKVDGLPLPARIDLRDSFEKEQHVLLNKLKTASGVDWKFEIDYKKLHDSITEDGRQEQLGRVIYWNLEGLVDNLVRKMSDDMVKEAVVDAAPKHVITLYIAEFDKSYHDVKFQDGAIHVLIKKDRVATNVGQIGDNIESLL